MKMTARKFRTVGGSPLLIAAAGLIWMFGSVVALAQTADVASAVGAVAPVVPQQVRYTGALASRSGGTVEAVFSIYATAEGGDALWTETQQVSVGADGAYTVLLGAATEKGLPQTVFAAGQARWLGVTVDQAEGPRSPLASVAYAMKAGDAETVGGVAAATLATKSDLAKMAQTVVTTVEAQPQFQTQPETAPTGSGTLNYVPLWTGSATLGNSGIFQAPSGFVGIGTTTPGGPLQLATGAQGGANATMMLTQTNAAYGNYYADLGLYNSNGLIGNLSALGAGYPTGQLFGPNDVVFLGGQQNAPTNLIFVTNTSGALKLGTGGYGVSNERLRIGAAGGVSVGNPYVGTDPGSGNMILSGKLGVGTTAPGANLEVNGTAKFDGLITFGAGQTFPGTGAGTITGVTASSPLTGGGTSGAVTVGLNTTALETTLNGVYAQLGAADTFADAATFSGGITANIALGGAYSAVYGAGTNGSFGVYGTSDTGYAVAGFSKSSSGVYGTSTTGSGGTFGTASATVPGVTATNSGSYSSGAIYPTALNATASGTSSVGVYGQGTLFGVYGSTSTSDSAAVLGLAGDGVGGDFNNSSTNHPTVYAENDAAGTATADPMGVEISTVGINAYGVYSVASGNGAFGLYGESDGTTESGSGRSGIGVKGLGTGADSNGMTADATGVGGYGIYAHASGAQDSKRYAPAGVYALANSGIGVEGFSVGESNLYKQFQTGFDPAISAGVWGDTSDSGSFDLAGILGTADNNSAGYFQNNSEATPTIQAYNNYNDNKGPTGLFKVFKASTAAGTCGIGDGNLSCTGQLKALASTGGGTRTVETYATQSAENWMEDCGSGAMTGGVGVVQIDATFADTVTADMSYHVFLTPLGDLKGPLYVTKVSATSFEVHEANGGTSSIGFDYKIVAKRRGFEAQRLVNVTDRFNAEQEKTKRMMPPATNAVASKRVEEPEMVERPASVGRAAALSAAMRTMRPAGGPVVPQMPIAPKSAVSPAQKPAVKQ